MLGACVAEVWPHLPESPWLFPMLRSGVDVIVVRDLLGHSSATTTSVYLHLLREDLQAGVDQAS